MLRPPFAFGALLVFGILSLTGVEAADAPAGVTAFKDAKAEGSFKFDLSSVDQKKPFFNPNFSADGFGLANVHVLLRKADHGAFNGQYGVSDAHFLMAASVVCMLPCVILFFAAQKYFVESVAMTGLKS